jgi:hypothetical protein
MRDQMKRLLSAIRVSHWMRLAGPQERLYADALESGGPQGPQGPQGPPGRQEIVASHPQTFPLVEEVSAWKRS